MYPSQPYPAPQPGTMNYPAQYSQPPQYPTAPPAPVYAPPAPPTYPPAGYPAQYPAQPAAPAAPRVTGTLDQFYAQPGGGSKAWSFTDPVTKMSKSIGTTYTGIVARPLTDGDIEQQTDPQSHQPAFFRDGSPKWVMKVPMNVTPDAEFPEGQATWYCRGQARDELARAMHAAGAPAGAPEAGARITVSLVGQRPPSRAGMNPRNTYAVRYERPAGAPPAPAVQSAPPAAQAAPAPAVENPYTQPAAMVGAIDPATQAQYAPPVPPSPYGGPYGPAQAPAQPMPPAPAQPAYAAPAAPAPMQGYSAPAQPAYAPQAAPQMPPPMAAAPAMPGLTPEQQALMAQLAGAGTPTA